MKLLHAKNVNMLEIVPSYLRSDAALIGTVSSYFQK